MQNINVSGMGQKLTSINACRSIENPVDKHSRILKIRVSISTNDHIGPCGYSGFRF